MLDIYCSGFISTLIDNSKDKESLFNTPAKYRKKLDDHIFIIQLTSKYSILDLYTATTLSQRFFTAQNQVQTLEKMNQMLSLYIQKFKLIFAKNDFDILSDHCHWNYTI